MRLAPVAGAGEGGTRTGTRPSAMARALAWAREEGEIVFYFGRQCMFERSTFGDVLERARRQAFDSTGKRVKITRRTWNWQPETQYRAGDGRLYRDQTAPLPPMMVRAQHGGEPGYEVEDHLLRRFGDVSRRMLAIERSHPTEKRVLEAYYGDRGSRFAAFSSDRYDPQDGHLIRGAGPGAIAALYVLTELGQTFLERERKKCTREGAAAKHQTDDDVLQTLLAVQEAQPKAHTTATLHRVRDESEALLLGAQKAWTATAPPKRMARSSS